MLSKEYWIKNIDLELFPSRFIGNVSIGKTFSPSNSADLASGNIDIASKQVNIPLYHFAEGRYTIAVYTEDLIIAFDINRLLPIVKEKGSIDDLEESTLRASLTNKELVDRNMEPSKNDIVAQPQSPEVTSGLSLRL